MSWRIAPLRIVFTYALPLLFLAILLVHAGYYLPFIADDTLISLRYAARLLQGQGLTWTDGRPVEGYSNLMWILLVALLGALRVDLVFASRMLGVLCMWAAVAFASAQYLAPRRQSGSLAGLVVGLLFFVGVGPIAVWAIAGLEQPLVAAAVAGAIPLYWAAADAGFRGRSTAFALSLLLGVLCLTRPDGPLFVVAFIVAALLHRPLVDRRQLWTFLAVVASLPVLFYGGQTIFRLAYYGAWLPNTALVKLSPSSHHLMDGLEYVRDGLLSLSPASFVALAFLAAGLLHPVSRNRFIPLLALLILWLSYLTAIGGDIFPAHRHFVPVVVVLTYTLAEGTAMAWSYLGGNPWKRTALIGGLTGTMALTIALQFNNQQNHRAITERWEWDCRGLALTLKGAFAEQRPLLAVTAAGCLPYWSELPALDMLGLNDYYLPRHKPQDVGSGLLGHELGDGEYILQRAPDIIVFNVGSRPAFRSGEQLAASEAFHQQYAEMRVRTSVAPSFTALVWFKVAGGAIGYGHNGGRLIIPAYFMNAFDTTTAFLRGDRLIVEVDSSHPVGVVVTQLPATYELTVVSQYSAQIAHRIEPLEDGVRLVLTTESQTPLPVEAVVITDTSR